MKKLTAIIAIIAITAIVAISPAAFAGDETFDSVNVTNVYKGMTKTGSPYVRLTMSEPSTLNGRTYNRSFVATVFDGDLVAQAETLKPGDKVSGVWSVGEYKGKPSYTIVNIQ